MKKNNVVYSLKFLLMLIVFLFSVSSVFSNSVEVFSNYDTHLEVTQNDTIEVNKSLTIKNVYDRGIVPGQIEFKIAKGSEGSVDGINVEKVKAFDQYGEEITTQTRNTQDYSVVILDIYYPLLPDFEYEFNLFYELSYEPSGIFFKSLQIPLRESTIPIQEGEFKVDLPNNNHFTYVDSNNVSVSSGKIENGTALWNIKDDQPSSIEFEYSYLPINIDGVKGSYVFWILINILVFIFLIYEVKKEVKRVKKNNEK